MVPTDLIDYRTRQQDAEKIGDIGWFSVRQTLVPHARIEADLTAAGLGAWVPKKTAASDDYRKATSAANRRVELDGGKYRNILIRPLDDNEDRIVRSVVIETLHKGKRLDYCEAAHVIFHRDSGRLTVKMLVDPGGPADEVVRDIRASFLARRGSVDQDTVRGMIKKVLDAHKAVTVRDTGAVFFIPREHCDIVPKLEKIAAAIPGAEFEAVPLVEDDPENPRKRRDLVARGVTAGVFLEVDQLLSDIREAGDQLSHRKAGTILNRFKDLKARTESYQSLLQDDLAEAVGRLELLSLSMMKVLDKAA